MPSQTEPPPPIFNPSVIPGRGRLAHVFVLERLGGIARNGVRAPANWPVLASCASKKPRTGYSPPATPIITLPLAMRGAMVMV